MFLTHSDAVLFHIKSMNKKKLLKLLSKSLDLNQEFRKLLSNAKHVRSQEYYLGEIKKLARQLNKNMKGN